MSLPRASLPEFASAVSVLDGSRWLPYRHLCYISDRILQALRRPGGGRLIVSIPPRNGKSRLVSHYLPLWYLECAPERHVILTSYGDRLAQDWGRKVRDSLAHKELHTTVRQDVAATNRWETPMGGGMVTAGVGGPIMGKGFHLGIVDDPHKSWDEAQSSVYRRKVIDWFEGTFMSRAEPGATVVLIQQRLHKRDLAGHLMAERKGEWDLVSLPAIAEEGDPLGRGPGEALCPERYPIDALHRMKANMSPAIWDAMQMQRPRPPGGTVIDPDWIRYYERAPESFDRVILSWDMTFKETASGSYVVGQVWGQVGADCYLLDQVRRRMDFPASLKAFRAQAEEWPEASAKLVEDKANGPAVISSLKSEIAGIVAVQVKGGKESRLHAVAPFFQAGNVLIPKRARWAPEYVAELTAFPGSEHDDQVDGTSQALEHLLLGRRKSTEDVTFGEICRASPWR